MRAASPHSYRKRPDSPKPKPALGATYASYAPVRENRWRDLAVERKLVELSGLFDVWHYVMKGGSEAVADPIGHYLTSGWLHGYEPNPKFAGALLLSYYETLGFSEPPLVTWLTLRSGGWFAPFAAEEIETLAERVRESDVFDQQFYLTQIGFLPDGLEPAIHYVLVGEMLGLAVSERFNSGYYRERHPDVTQPNSLALLHYLEHGKQENRRAIPIENYRSGQAAYDPCKANVIVVCHETSRTGAPILGWNIARELSRRYNLYTIHLGGGELTADFRELSVGILGPFLGADRNELDIELSVNRLLSGRSFRYAIVNSAEARVLVPFLARRYVPTLLLVHEFGAYVYPAHTFRSALDWATEVVFPARIVAEAAAAVHPAVCTHTQQILPQGASLVPASRETAVKKVGDGASQETLRELTRRHDEQDVFVVLGAGTVHLRKGVELFIAAASAVARSESARTIHFLWVGHGFSPKEDMAYSMYLQEQLSRSHVSAHLTFLDAVSDLDPVYRIADAFFLSSRLDPLPNVSIDAALLGIPLVCFRDASGTAELLASNAEAALGIVDHLDAEAAARFIVTLANDGELHGRMSRATRAFAQGRFEMAAYVSELDRLGIAAGERMRQQALDAETLAADSTFDQDLFLGSDQIVETREATIARYLALGAARTWEPIVVANTALRRPSPGFNPRLFAESYPETISGHPDPLAEYIRRGKPAGRWQAQVLGPDDEYPQAYTTRRLRVALHAHLFYPDLVGELLTSLRSNQTRCDLWVTTDERSKALQLEEGLSRYEQGNVFVRVVPNRGRDFGPLLTGLAADWDGYDVIGHVHGKRSVGKAGGWDKGDEWREFCWQNLLGGTHSMLDRIAAAFEQQNRLGLVFPCDPHLVGWDENLPAAQRLAERLGWQGELPRSFDFPLGSMFWARRQALQPILQTGLTWEDYPAEPVPSDGTILHALERMLPTICCDLAGFQYAVTHLFGISWTS